MLFLGGILLLLQALGEPGRVLLRYDRAALAGGELWRVLSGHFVHLSWWHWAVNEIALLVLVLLCPQALSPWVWLRRVLLLALATSAGLWWCAPQVQWYVGLSGVTHGLFVLGLGRLLWQRDPIAAGCLAFLFAKLAWESVAGASLADEQALGGAVAVQSHLSGTAGAILYGLAFRAFWRDETATGRTITALESR